jgi:hypothetical protein
MASEYAQNSPYNYLGAIVSLPAPAALDGTEVIGAFKSNNAAGPLPNPYVQVTAAQIAALADQAPASPSVGYAALTATTNATLTAAQTQPGRDSIVVVDMTGTAAAPSTLTLPTVAALVTALGADFVAGMSWLMRVINHNADNDAWTLTTAAGWTLTGTLSVAQSTYRDFVVTLTSATAGTVQDVGGGTIV